MNPDFEELVNSCNHIMEELSELRSPEYPRAVQVLSKDIYVYDVNPGADTGLELDEQILPLNQY